MLDSHGEPLRLALETGVFLFKPSLREFQDLIGRGGLDDAELTEAARPLIREGQCTVVDTMVAGIVLSLARTLSLGDSVRFGVAAAAAAVMNPGTQLCRREDVERLFDGLRSREVRDARSV